MKRIIKIPFRRKYSEFDDIDMHVFNNIIEEFLYNYKESFNLQESKYNKDVIYINLKRQITAALFYYIEDILQTLNLIFIKYQFNVEIDYYFNKILKYNLFDNKYIINNLPLLNDIELIKLDECLEIKSYSEKCDFNLFNFIDNNETNNLLFNELLTLIYNSDFGTMDNNQIRDMQNQILIHKMTKNNYFK